MQKRFTRNLSSKFCCFLAIILFAAPLAQAERIGDYDFPDIAMIDGYPVYQIGDVAIYRVSPTFVADLVLQRDNKASLKKIVPKRSHEIRSNYIGAMAEHIPTSGSGKAATSRSIVLIDGNIKTGFQFLGRSAPSLEGVWCRIDLPRETKIKSVNLVAMQNNNWGVNPFPLDYEIYVSRDAWHWDMVCSIKSDRSSRTWQWDVEGAKGIVDEAMPAPGTKVRHAFAPCLAKQIKIKVRRMPLCGFDTGYVFGLNEIEIEDETGRNVALLTHGSTAMVSSLGKLKNLDNDTWPLIYDLGFKWLRLGMGNDNWLSYEKEKGKYAFDEVTKQKYEEARSNGLELMYCFLSMPSFYIEGEQPYHHILGFPESPEQMEGLAKFAEYMATTFKGTIRYWVILAEYFNEIHYPVHRPGIPGTIMPGQLDTYTALLKKVSPILRKIDPANKVLFQDMASICVDGVEGCFQRGAAPLVDYITWNAAWWLAPETIDRESLPWARNRPEITSYEDVMKELASIAEKYGYQGGYMANGSWFQARYPDSPHPTWPYRNQTELLKAKYCARALAMHSGMGMVYTFCKTIIPGFSNDAGLIKTAVPSGRGPVMTTQAAYYAVRSMCTLLDGAEPVDLPFNVSTDVELMKYAFTLPGGNHLFALWQPIDGADDYQGIPLDVIIPVPGGGGYQVMAQDPLNGVEQALISKLDERGVVIPGLLVKDYPLLLKVIHKPNT